MYVNIDISVKIGDFEINNLKSIRIENTLNSLMDTAKISLPREFKINNQTDFRGKYLLDIIQKDMPVTIKFGYNGNLESEFVGYIKNIGAEIPILIECEDEMSRLKKSKKYNLSFDNIKLEDLLKAIAPGYNFEVGDISLGKLNIENATAYEVLEDLRKFGIKCWFDGKTLKAGTMLSLASGKKHQYSFGRNIRESSDLKYVSKDKKEIKIKAISLQKGTSEKVIYEFGKNINGERTLHAPLNLNKGELKIWSEDYYKNIVFDGYEGNLDGWCVPRTKAGDTLSLIDPNYPTGERDGDFLIESVVTDVNAMVGIKRSNKISIKL
ncbi:hypothetical protein [Psychroflexus sp. ALD_RP9]|uniref:hypothetical protein n=1 Tax=Psychroflexus sp. ALD_RP9 TaxID=2777186 RepID=UPI001A8E85CB|nr:hypothetical protein [Psychroflexus sp. ALD_RP9]QSS96585.1 hypothetical protein IMZ30_09040 [Psychroflexus sp. ALD_RP9]